MLIPRTEAVKDDLYQDAFSALVLYLYIQNLLNNDCTVV